MVRGKICKRLNSKIKSFNTRLETLKIHSNSSTKYGIRCSGRAMHTRRPRISINDAPTEILLYIFQYLKPIDLWQSVQFVCQRWASVSRCDCLWKEIEADNNVPTDMLREWLKFAPTLKSLKLVNRNDADIILSQVSKYNKRLQSLQAISCWGTQFHPNVRARPLCDLLKRCPVLKNISFDRTRFRSCKFYELIANYSNIHDGKQSADGNKDTPHVIHHFNATWPCLKQIRAFLAARARDNAQTDLILQSESSVSHAIRLTGPDEHNNVEDNINYLDPVLEEIFGSIAV